MSSESDNALSDVLVLPRTVDSAAFDSERLVEDAWLRAIRRLEEVMGGVMS